MGVQSSRARGLQSPSKTTKEKSLFLRKRNLLLGVDVAFLLLIELRLVGYALWLTLYEGHVVRWPFVAVTFLFNFQLINKVIPIRMEPHEELLGADFFEHDIKQAGVGVSRWRFAHISAYHSAHLGMLVCACICRAVSVLKHFHGDLDHSISSAGANQGEKLKDQEMLAMSAVIIILHPFSRTQGVHWRKLQHRKNFRRLRGKCIGSDLKCCKYFM